MATAASEVTRRRESCPNTDFHELTEACGAMLVGTNSTLLLGIRRTLGTLGFTVYTASDAHEALVCGLDAEAPLELVIVDTTQLEEAQTELLAELRQRYPRIRVLFLVNRDGRSLLRKNRPSNYLHVPFSPEELHAFVLEALRCEACQKRTCVTKSIPPLQSLEVPIALARR